MQENELFQSVMMVDLKWKSLWSSVICFYNEHVIKPINVCYHIFPLDLVRISFGRGVAQDMLYEQ